MCYVQMEEIINVLCSKCKNGYSESMNTTQCMKCEFIVGILCYHNSNILVGLIILTTSDLLQNKRTFYRKGIRKKKRIYCICKCFKYIDNWFD